MGAALTIKIRDWEKGKDMDRAEALRRLRSGKTVVTVPVDRRGSPLAGAVTVYPPGLKYGKPAPGDVGWSSPVPQPPEIALAFAGAVKLAAGIAAAAGMERRPERRTAARITTTAACAREHLLRAGLPEARIDSGTGRAVSEGFTVSVLPIAAPRFAVYWDSPRRGRGRLEDCRRALKAAGFKTEVIADRPADYLVAWTEGRS